MRALLVLALLLWFVPAARASEAMDHPVNAKLKAALERYLAGHSKPVTWCARPAEQAAESARPQKRRARGSKRRHKRIRASERCEHRPSTLVPRALHADTGGCHAHKDPRQGDPRIPCPVCLKLKRVRGP